MINFRKASQPLLTIIFTKLQTTIVIIQKVKNLTYLLPKTTEFLIFIIKATFIQTQNVFQQWGMFKAIFFYQVLLYIVFAIHFINVLSIPHLNRESVLIYKTVPSSIFLNGGTFSNILTNRYLSNISIYKNHFACLWILILLAT